MSKALNWGVVFGVVAVIVIVLLLGKFENAPAGNILTGYATFGDGTNSSCGAYINEDSTLIGNITNCSVGYSIIINASNITLNCQGFAITGYTSAGIRIYNKNNVTIKNCITISSNWGMSIQYSDNISILNNTLRNTSSGGIWIEGSRGNILSGNIVEKGFAIGDSSDNIFSNNIVPADGVNGFYVQYGGIGTNVNNTFINNTVYNATYGFFLRSSGNVSLANNTLYNNSYDFYIDTVTFGESLIFNMSQTAFLNPSGTLENYTVLDMNDLVAASSSYSITWNPRLPSYPHEKKSFANKFINITKTGGVVSIDSVVWHWDDSDLTGYNESSFGLWKYNSSNWTLLNDTPDTTNNIIAVTDLDPESIFGILFTLNNHKLCPSIVMCEYQDFSEAIFGENSSGENITILNYANQAFVLNTSGEFNITGFIVQNSTNLTLDFNGSQITDAFFDLGSTENVTIKNGAFSGEYNPFVAGSGHAFIDNVSILGTPSSNIYNGGFDLLQISNSVLSAGGVLYSAPTFNAVVLINNSIYNLSLIYYTQGLPVGRSVMVGNYFSGVPVGTGAFNISGNTFDNGASLFVQLASNIYNNVFANESFLSSSVNHGIINSTFYNIQNHTIVLSDNARVVNTTFTNIGRIEPQYVTNFAYGIFSGINFSGCILLTDGTSLIVLNSTGEKSVPLADGTNDFSILLHQDTAGALSGFGCGENITLYATGPFFGVDCPTIEGLVGGTCRYNLTGSAVIANGFGSDYTWNATLASDGVTFSATPHLAFDNASRSTVVFAINITGNNNTITGNIFKNSPASPIAFDSGSSNNKIYLNVFTTGNLSVYGTNNSFCVNGNGNFYEEGLVPVSGDCGQVNLTSNRFTDSVRFNRQSSPVQPVHYEIFNNRSGVLSLVGNISSSQSQISLNWPFGVGNYVVRIVPWIEGSRINGTPFSGSFTLSTPSEEAAGGGGVSVNVPPYISREKVTEEGELPPRISEVVTAKPTEEKPAPSPFLEKPVEAPTMKLPVWLLPLLIILAILVIVAAIIAYELKKTKRKKK